MRSVPVRRWLALLLLAVAVVAAPPGGSPTTFAAAPVAAAPATAEQPSTSFEAWFDADKPLSAPFEAVQMVVDFPPGAQIARHTHGGDGYITMLDGAMTMSIGDQPARPYGPNESFVERFSVVAAGGNLTAASASLIVTYILPVGAAVTTLAPSEGAATSLPGGQLPPGASPRFESRMRLESAPDQYRVGQMLKSYAPGAWSMSEIATAPRLLTVVSGEVHVLSGAGEKVYRQGGTWIEEPGTAYLSGNVGSGEAVVAVSVVQASR